MKIPITQAKEWQKLQEDLGEESFFEKKSDYQYLAIKKHTPIGNYLYLPYGPVAKDAAGFKEAIKSLQTLAKSKGTIFIRIEPMNSDFIKLFPKNTQKSKDLSPKETWVLNLDKDKESIILGFSHGVRNPYNTAKKRGLIVETTKDTKEIHHLVELQQALAKAKNIHTFSESYLKSELNQPFAILYQVKYQRPESTPPSPDLPFSTTTALGTICSPLLIIATKSYRPPWRYSLPL